PVRGAARRDHRPRGAGRPRDAGAVRELRTPGGRPDRPPAAGRPHPGRGPHVGGLGTRRTGSPPAGGAGGTRRVARAPRPGAGGAGSSLGGTTAAALSARGGRVGVLCRGTDAGGRWPGGTGGPAGATG